MPLDGVVEIGNRTQYLFGRESSTLATTLSLSYSIIMPWELVIASDIKSSARAEA